MCPDVSWSDSDSWSRLTLVCSHSLSEFLCVKRRKSGFLHRVSTAAFTSAAKGTKISSLWSFLTAVVRGTQRAFITDHHSDLSAFTPKPEKKENDSGITAARKRCLQPWSASWTQHQLPDNPLVGRVKWKRSLVWGGGRGRLVCALLAVDGSMLLSNVIQHGPAPFQPGAETVACTLGAWLFMYLPWIFTQAHHVPKRSTSPPKPSGTRQKTARSSRLQRLAVCWVMNSVYAEQKCSCASAGWAVFVRSSEKINTPILL